MKNFIKNAALAVTVGLFASPFEAQAKQQNEAPPIRGHEEARHWKERLESLGMWPEPTVRQIKDDVFSHQDQDDVKRYAEWYKELKKRAAAQQPLSGASQ